ncbi:MAG: HAD family hydrolase [Lentisphaerae bacterium]|nr:HAD family hydrolase [Lentisphaerota bacterium]
MNKLVVFDLDGTLIDSAGGIAHSVNRTRQHLGFKPLDKKLIASFTGDGIRKLLERSCADVTLPIPMEEVIKMTVDFYAADPVHDTAVYPGVMETLPRLREAGFKLAVLSNKPQVVSDKILKGLNIAQFMDANIGGEAGFPLKPAPDGLLYLMKKFETAPENTWMTGDNHTDLAVAANAGCRSIFCKFGMGFKGDYTANKDIDRFDQLADHLI